MWSPGFALFYSKGQKLPNLQLFLKITCLKNPKFLKYTEKKMSMLFKSFRVSHEEIFYITGTQVWEICAKALFI